MKVTGLSGKAGKFMSMHWNLPIATSGVIIRIIEYDKRLHVMMEIGEDTTDAQIREASWLARKWRDLLHEYQGTWTYGGENKFYYLLMVRREHGIKPSEIAKELNEEIEEYLREYVKFLNENKQIIETEFSGSLTLMDAIKNPHYQEILSGEYQLVYAKDIMQLMGLSDNYIQEYCLEAFECIEKDLPMPKAIQWRMVEQKLRHWKETKKYKNIKDGREKSLNPV